MKKFIFVVEKQGVIVGEVVSHAPSFEEAQREVDDMFKAFGMEFIVVLDKIVEED